MIEITRSLESIVSHMSYVSQNVVTKKEIS